MENNQELKKFGKWYLKAIGFIVFMLVLLIVLGIIGTISEADGVSVTKKYNQAVNEYNTLVNEYNLVLENCCIDNIAGLDYYELLSNVSESTEDIQISFKNGNSVEKIKTDTKTINEWIEELEDKIVIVKQIVAPEEAWVIERLAKIERITEIAGVTEETDVNGMLGKDGGYTSCIYFGLAEIDTSTVAGNDIVEKGTDAGGAIEVYATVKDAEARCEYLSEYDNTLLYSGSYAIVGTMVIRTSYKLISEDQLELTDIITKEFTKIY